MGDAKGHVDQVVIVRMWQEDAEDGDSAASWRGRIEHLNSGRQTHFVGLEVLLETLRAIAAAASEPCEPPS